MGIIVTDGGTWNINIRKGKIVKVSYCKKSYRRLIKFLRRKYES